jgi:pimeloyl-ACP methyl ester carboxylesterase
MPKTSSNSPADYIVPLNINGLDGRMLKAPAFSGVESKEILLIYGHHAMLERWWTLVQNLQEYGNVTMPDLPGFGGMDSFARINRYPNIDAYADYLAAFIKLRYRRKKFVVIGISFGFLVITRMLQRYPELTKKITLVVSIVGFMHKDDFVYPARNRKMFAKITRVFATREVALFIR